MLSHETWHSFVIGVRVSLGMLPIGLVSIGLVWLGARLIN